MSFRHEFSTPEHLLYAFLMQDDFCSVLDMNAISAEEMTEVLGDWIACQEHLPGDDNYEVRPSAQYIKMFEYAAAMVQSADTDTMDVPHIVQAILSLKDSVACNMLNDSMGDDKPIVLSDLVTWYEHSDEDDMGGADDDEDDDGSEGDGNKDGGWHTQVLCLNDEVAKHNPLIGREEELERTIQVLCRKEKNNPLHLGEPGVGKTAIVYGLAERINRDQVPPRLKGSRIYMMDMGSMLAGTQYRGDFEKRMKQVLEGARKEGNAIIYIDEIHSIVGAGTGGDGALDASNMLKPYLESGDIRFIGSTTYAEYNRYFARSKGIVRRFQQIDIAEPSTEDTVNILKGLQKSYETFHGVRYARGVIEFAVEQTAKHIADRFLPDKAIDLIDEAGAYREIHPTTAKTQTVDKALVNDILTRICKIDATALKETSNTSLRDLEKRMLAQVYGQDEAIRYVVEAVEMAKAGLTDDDKPLASLLFVGPTGVGKTEVARTLAKEMGIELVRFDMSEYTERHAVSKLIGSPAGYVGYEDGGLLVDAIRKSPNCVLLLDEIEKAHDSIYNILLQVMDYARLTDNHGQKADFRNVILILTSNAGAQYASQANVGFNSHTSRGEAMLAQVKKTFKPEFINRLSGTVVFHDMDQHMASLILDKKLRQLQTKLDARGITLTLTPEARQHLLKAGFTRQYGAREMDRVLSHELKPLLMREILFGRLKKGGAAKVSLTTNGLALEKPTK